MLYIGIIGNGIEKNFRPVFVQCLQKVNIDLLDFFFCLFIFYTFSFIERSLQPDYSITTQDFIIEENKKNIFFQHAITAIGYKFAKGGFEESKSLFFMCLVIPGSIQSHKSGKA